MFLAQDTDSQVACYSHADLLRRDRADAVLGFAEFWKKSYGRLPGAGFGEKATPYPGGTTGHFESVWVNSLSPAAPREQASNVTPSAPANRFCSG